MLSIIVIGQKEKGPEIFKKAEEEVDYSKTPKAIHAYAYIIGIAESEVTDRTAYMGHENDIYLPYRQLRFFYGEYEHYCAARDVPLWQTAGESLFRRSFSAVRKHMKVVKNKTLKFNGGKMVCLCVIYSLCGY